MNDVESAEKEVIRRVVDDGQPLYLALIRAKLNYKSRSPEYHRLNRKIKKIIASKNDNFARKQSEFCYTRPVRFALFCFTQPDLPNSVISAAGMQLQRHRAKQQSIMVLKKELAEAKAEATTDQSARYVHR